MSKLPDVATTLGCTIDELFEREDEAAREGKGKRNDRDKDR